MPAQYLNNFMGSVADCTDAFTAGLFVSEAGTARLRLRAFHSLSDAVIPDAVIGDGQGFLSWVMKNQRPIQVPRFNRDSRTLGYYSEDVGLKSFLSVPMPGRAGVICVDSRSRFAFAVKHERILESIASAALDLLEAERQKALAGFYSRIMRWQMTSFNGPGAAMEAFLDILCLETAVILRHLEGTSFLVVEDLRQKHVVRGPAVDIRGERIPLGQGMAGWVAKHRSSILMDRRSRGTEKRFILFPEEPLVSGPTVAGIFCPSGNRDLDVNYCFMFAGEADPSSWPPEFLEIMEFLLKGLVPWH